MYQPGHKLYCLNENYYDYDKAGRLVAKVEKRDGFRKQETHYRWNGKNELVGLTTPKGDVWYYKYDALGRRISKECPQQQLRIEYLWDGDQLAFTRTFKNDEIISEQHSIFNGFELITQQDRYQQLKQTIDGNFIEWKQETGYAICQQNGQVLALLNPQGKTLWRKEKHSLWGLLFPNDYRKTTPLDPQMLFAGQWLDEESGLYYNRYRYYNPTLAQYISPDPIGLLGGFNPYGYVAIPTGWVDLFGLAGCKKWQKYEQQIQDLYGGKSDFDLRAYRSIVDGKRVNRIADNILAGSNTAIEAKYVDNWAKSIRNPASKIGNKSFAIKEQAKVLTQAKKYSNAFSETIYHTNSKEFAKYYDKVFKDAGINNIKFEITPFTNRNNL